MIWNLGTMLPNEIRLITLTVWVEPWAAAIFTNTVNASSQTADPDPNNLVDTEPTAVGNPTAVTIVSFNAIQSEGYDVDIAWDVASGLGVYAFKVYRTTTNSFDNPDYITSIAWDRARVYTAQDTVPAYGQYWYWLTEHSTSGAEGPPVSSTTITVGPRYKIYLPLVLR